MFEVVDHHEDECFVGLLLELKLLIYYHQSINFALHFFFSNVHILMKSKSTFNVQVGLDLATTSTTLARLEVVMTSDFALNK